MKKDLEILDGKNLPEDLKDNFIDVEDDIPVTDFDIDFDPNTFDFNSSTNSKPPLYAYTYVPTHLVAKNIGQYVIPECQEACKAFWNKNMFTFMCSNYDELDNTKYVLLFQLSEENQQIMKKLIQTQPENYYYSNYRNSYGIRISEDGTTEEIAKKLAELTKPFQMQDILEGTMTKEAFLADICELVKYKTFSGKEYDDAPKSSDFDNIFDYFDAKDEFLKDHPDMEPHIEREFDPSLQTKPFEEYLKEYGYEDLYDSTLGIIYEDKFYKEHHQMYLDYLKSKTSKRPDSKEFEDSLSIKDVSKALSSTPDIKQDIDKTSASLDEDN